MILLATALTVLASTPVNTTATFGVPEGSPTWGFEVRLGSFRPKPSNNQVAAYNRLVFGNDSPVFWQLELDRYLGYALGPIGLYGRVGRWSQSGSARVCDSNATDCNLADPTSITESNSTAGNSETNLSLLPIGLGLVYRFAYLMTEYDVPIVPYVKGGFEYVIWNNSTEGDTATRVGANGNTQRGNGGTYGLSGAIGIALGLSWIDPSPARSSVAAFLESYIFAEYVVQSVNNFGEREVFDFSSDYLMAGLALDFD